MKTKVRKALSLLSVILVLTMLVSACTTGVPGGAAEGSATEIEFWTFQDLHVEFYEVMAEKWNEANPDEQINFIPTVYPFDDMHNKLLIAFQSGVGAPDLVDIEIGKYANFLRGDIQLLPLNDVVEPELDNIVKARVDIYSKDGSFYGICFHVGAAVIYYNAELCEAVGIDWENINTWDEYYAAGEAFKAANPDLYWTSVESGDIWHMWPMISSQGSDMLAADGTPTIATPEMAKALEFNKKMVDEGIAVVAPGSPSYHHSEEFYQLMNSGAIASISMPMWYMDRFTDHMPDLSGKMAIAPLPVWEEGQPRSVGMGGTGTSVTAQSENADLVKRFLAFAKLSKEGNIEVWNTMGFDPIRTEVWSLPEVTEAVNKFTDYYVTTPFEVLNQIKDEILPVNVSDALPATLDVMKNSVLNRAYTEDGIDIPAMLEEEQAKIQY
ncbi:MAG: extracellular solute-binding protein [Clostridiales bacterium]|jgi:arabinosaccharide transport system substrate-binding protein|nr:extracellular solute-binding protein [Clostridiales bacterium]